MVKFEISIPQREVLEKLVRMAIQAHVALIAVDPELGGELADVVRETKEMFGVE